MVMMMKGIVSAGDCTQPHKHTLRPPKRHAVASVGVAVVHERKSHRVALGCASRRRRRRGRKTHWTRAMSAMRLRRDGRLRGSVPVVDHRSGGRINALLQGHGRQTHCTRGCGMTGSQPAAPRRRDGTGTTARRTPKPEAKHNRGPTSYKARFKQGMPILHTHRPLSS